MGKIKKFSTFLGEFSQGEFKKGIFRLKATVGCFWWEKDLWLPWEILGKLFEVFGENFNFSGLKGVTRRMWRNSHYWPKMVKNRLIQNGEFWQIKNPRAMQKKYNFFKKLNFSIFLKKLKS